jgi:membrane associated rhomboid family serine protease
MIPLRDNIPSTSVPFLNYAIMSLCVLVFFLEMSMGRELEEFFQAFGFVPRNFSLHLGHGNALGAILPIFTSMFLHGGWFHLLGNMWTLFIFGDNVEDTLGHVKFLLLYLVSGAAACFAQLLSSPYSSMPMVGASGAIAGIMGAYFALFPGGRILTLIPVLFFVIIEIPAYVFLGIWFLLQFFFGTFSILGAATEGGVAFWAHVGGFITGYLFLRVLAPGRYRSPFQARA